jgi:pimeloyl-ACP methyl ester carboxylesterase
MQEFASTVAGLTIRGVRGGDGRPVVVLHHSFGHPGPLPFYDELAADHTVWVPDLPGFGASDRPEWARHPRDLALLIGHFLRRERIAPAAIVGMGFGGWIAAELATMAPELLSKLVLVGAAGLLPEEGRIYDQILVSHSEYVKAAFKDTDVYTALYDDPPSDDTLIAWDVNREMMTRVAWKPYMYNRQMAPLLCEVGTPTLLVWGDADAIVPRVCAEQYRRLLPDAQLEIVGDCGHAVDMERPAELAAIVSRFLKS